MEKIVHYQCKIFCHCSHKLLCLINLLNCIIIIFKHYNNIASVRLFCFTKKKILVDSEKKWFQE